MTPLRMLILLIFAAVLVNLVNYLLCTIYTPFNRRPKALKRQWPTVSATHNLTKFLCITCNDSTSEGRALVDDVGYAELTVSVKGLYTYYPIHSKRNGIPLCPEIPPKLGLILDDPIIKSMKVFDKLYSEVQLGGIYTPSDCVARQAVAIIVPFRNNMKSANAKHLGTFMYVLHPFLMKQQLEYQIFVVEQANRSQPFNRGKLINAAFTEVQKRRDQDTRFHCIIIHEPHLVPVDTRNLYRCSWYPRQLATFIETTESPIEPQFGGVFSISVEQFLRVNGFSNLYWGNDGDYEDLLNRITNANYTIDRSPTPIGKYTTLNKYQLPVAKKSKVAQTSSPFNLIDGLTTIAYTLNDYEYKYVFTYMNITLDDDTSDSAVVGVSLQN